MKKGTTISEQQRIHLKEVMKEVMKRPEVREKISKALKGRKRKPFTKEWREKLSLAKKGKTWEELYADKVTVMRVHHKEALNRPECKEKRSKIMKKVWERKRRKEKINRVLNKVKKFFIGKAR